MRRFKKVEEGAIPLYFQSRTPQHCCFHFECRKRILARPFETIATRAAAAIIRDPSTPPPDPRSTRLKPQEFKFKFKFTPTANLEEHIR
jgi:hypothetical protein